MRLLLERALLPGGVASDVLVRIEGGRFAEVVSEYPHIRVSPHLSGHARHNKSGEPPTSATADHPERVRGLAIPGFANTHSHAFHRALRGRTQHERGTFWTWREQMYSVAGRLDPDSYFALARATYREMAAAGITTVGEFHYLHHAPDGRSYDDANAMSHALVAAAREAGVRIALLDTCYLSSGFGAAPEGVQKRYDDRSAAAWAERVGAMTAGDGVVVGAAIHSVRAVPADQIPTVVEAAAGRPLHVHLSEQRAENEACLAHHGVTPSRLLHERGALGPLTTAVHATHLTDDDVRLLGESGTFSGFCPTTERDLGDGIGPSRALHAAGSPVSLGSDSHAVIDPAEEMRALEMDERLATEQRGHWTAAEMLRAAARHDSLGFADAGAIEVGRRADLVVLDTTTPRTAGTGADEHTAAFAATAADVRWTMADGRIVFRQGDGEEIGRELDAAIGGLWA